MRAVLDTGEEDPGVSGKATAGEGTLINSGSLNGLPKAEAIPAAIGSSKSRAPAKSSSTSACATGC